MAKLTGIKIKNDFSKAVLAMVNDRIEIALEAVGQTAEGYAKKECPVDTGRLRNSITWATSEKQGEANKSPKAKAKEDDYKMKGKPLDKFVYIGTNVEYAPYIEYEDMKHKTGNAHFLKNAATNHTDHYKEIFKKALGDIK